MPSPASRLLAVVPTVASKIPPQRGIPYKKPKRRTIVRRANLLFAKISRMMVDMRRHLAMYRTHAHALPSLRPSSAWNFFLRFVRRQFLSLPAKPSGAAADCIGNDAQRQDATRLRRPGLCPPTFHATLWPQRYLLEAIRYLAGSPVPQSR